MRVLVDTSVWVDFFNAYPSPERALLGTLLNGDDDVCTCGIVVAELFQGLRREPSRRAIQALFTEMTFLEATGIEIYLRAADVYRTLRQRGTTVRSTVDCLIAAVAERHGCRLLARDRDLRAIIESGVVRTAAWSGENA